MRYFLRKKRDEKKDIEMKQYLSGPHTKQDEFLYKANALLDSKVDYAVDIRFEELGLKLRNGKSVLAGVTGELRHGRLTAILGGSGAGKINKQTNKQTKDNEANIM